jgi:SAM-dependent methyltransferase
MNHRFKSAIRHSILALPGGAPLYRWITGKLLGTQAGMTAKWFRVFPAHIKVLQRVYGDAARAQSLWCQDCGASPAAALAMALATDKPGLLTDRFDRCGDRYLDACRSVLAEKGRGLAELSHAPPDRFEAVTAAAQQRTAHDVMRDLGMSYSRDYSIIQNEPWRGKLGMVFSAGTLEHYRPDEIRPLLEMTRDCLQPGGVLSHVMDHRDHRWHADKTISPLLHLTLSEEAYARRFSNPLDYHNRWMRSQWVALLEELGFTVECHDVFTYTDDLTPLRRDQLAPEFRALSDADLRALVTHFVAVKR